MCIPITISNIGAEPNFEKLTTSEATTNNIQYDYRSVMHYSAYAFSRNGRPTIEPVLSGVSRNDLGQRSGLSTNDIKHAQQLYCSKSLLHMTLILCKETLPAAVANYFSNIMYLHVATMIV